MGNTKNEVGCITLMQKEERLMNIQQMNEAKVWCEELHKMVLPSVKCEVESGCYDPKELAEEFKENIYLDIFGYDADCRSSHPTTGETFDGVAYIIICDGSEYDLCEGWDRSDIFTRIDEDGIEYQWFAVRELNEEDDEDEEGPAFYMPYMEVTVDGSVADEDEKHYSIDGLTSLTLKMNQCSLSREKTDDDNWTSYRCPTAWLNVPNNISSEDIYHDLAVCGFSGIALETLKTCICFGVFMDKDDEEWNDINNIFENTWNLCQE